MADSGKRKRATCIVDMMTCKTCGASAVSINGRRVTGHKCVGAWTIVRSESVEVAEVHRALAQKVTA